MGLHLLLVATGAIAIAAVARRRGWPAPLLLVLAGLVVSPFMPSAELDPELVLFVFLPPLLYSAALDSSYLNLRDVKRPVALLSIGLVLFTTFVVGWTVHLLVPSMPMAAAFALGAIIAPPDAVAAVAVGRRLGLPRRALTILVGESLFNDATALTAYRVAIGIVMGGAVGQASAAVEALGVFLRATVLGTLIGLALALVIAWILERTRDSLVETTVMLLVPFGAYLAAEMAHASGVIAVVIVGLYLGHRMHRRGFGTRLVSSSVWRVTDFLLESIVFALIGLQLVPILQGLKGRSPWELAGAAVLVFLVTVAARFVWVFPAAYLQAWLIKSVPWPSAKQITIVGWAGMRGVVSLAAAIAIPFTIERTGAPFPDRDLMLFLTFTTVIGTLLVQGLTFPWLIRKLKVTSEQERYEDNLSEASAQQAALDAGLQRLDEVVAAEGEPDEIQRDAIAQLRAKSQRRAMTAWERLGGGTGQDGAETPSTYYRRLRREMLDAERAVFVRLRDERRLEDEVMRRVMADLDFEEALMER
ncbi:Na+/H+ antiporter [Nonomuraea sp. NPDC050556]|uniref:Na+/H+ antiporter n=1 Tax=Nonomuraea sp. NPDC050556 TaxID=3364369 RepID=UPI0037B84E3C